jgi:Uma2 family endonuclease
MYVACCRMFIELTKESENQYEFIDGQIYLMSSPGVSHQMIQTKIMSNFYGWFSGKKCIPFTAPFDIILTKQSGSKNVVQPDILVICDINEKTDKEDRYQGTPELVLEIMSKTSKRKDMILKLDLYFQTGIKEYWLVDPFLKTIAVYKFENREISDLSVFKGTETAHSFIFKGLKVELEKIF